MGHFDRTTHPKRAAAILLIALGGLVLPWRASQADIDARKVCNDLQHSRKQFVAAALEVVGEPECIQDICSQKVRLLEVFACRGREFKAGDIVDFSNVGAVGSQYLGILVPMKNEVFGSKFLAIGATDEDRRQFAAELAAAGLKPGV